MAKEPVLIASSGFSGVIATDIGTCLKDCAWHRHGIGCNKIIKVCVPVRPVAFKQQLIMQKQKKGSKREGIVIL